MINFDTIRVNVAEILTIPAQDLADDMPFEATGNWDSLAKVGVAALVFEATRKNVTRQDMDRVADLRGVFDLIRSKAGA